MNALDLKFDTDYRVIVEGSYFFKGDIVRRSGVRPWDDSYGWLSSGRARTITMSGN